MSADASDAAAAYFSECLAVQQELGAKYRDGCFTIAQAITLLNLGDLACERVDEKAAHTRCEESLELARPLGDAGLLELVSQRLGIQVDTPIGAAPWHSRLVDVGDHRLFMRCQAGESSTARRVGHGTGNG